MHLSALLLLSVILPGGLRAEARTLEDVKRLVAAQGGGTPGEAPGPYAERGVKVLLDNRFEYFPWEYTQAARIKNGYGMKAFVILAENYTEITEAVLGYCAEIDSEYALLAFEALARQYATLYAWQVRWASEVQSGREYGAYSNVVSSRHTEKEEAEAALLDGLKSEVTVTRERREMTRIERSFATLLRDAVGGLPGACRMRLSGAEVTLREMHEAGIPADTVLRFEKPAAAPSDPGVCSERRPGKLTFYWGPYYVAHGQGDRTALQELMMSKVGCRKTPRPRRLFAQGPRPRDDFRDAPAPLKRAKSCPVPRTQAPRFVVSTQDEVRTEKVTTRLITEGMENNVAEPSRPAPADAAPPGKLVAAP